jgi:hypothetical protein
MVRRWDLAKVEKRWRVLAYAWDLCEIRFYARLSPSWPPLLALIWGTRSRDPVQVSYRCLQTLTSLGLLGLRMPILFMGCSRYANIEDPRGHTLITKLA